MIEGVKRTFLEGWRVSWRRPWLYLVLCLLPVGQSFLNHSYEMKYGSRTLSGNLRLWIASEPHLSILFHQVYMGSIAWIFLAGFAVWGVGLKGGRAWWVRNNPWGSRWALGLVLTSFLYCALVLWFRHLNAFSQPYLLISLSFWFASALSVASAILTNPLPILWAAAELRGGWDRDIPRRTWATLAVLPLFPEMVNLIAGNLKAEAEIYRIQGGVLPPLAQRVLSVAHAANNPYYWRTMAVALLPLYWLVIELRSGLAEGLFTLFRLRIPRLLAVYGWILLFSAISFALFACSKPSRDDWKMGRPAWIFSLARDVAITALSIPWWFGLRHLVRQALSDQKN